MSDTNDEKTLKAKHSLLKDNRKVFDELIVRKMFVVPSFEIYGGVKGLFDLGPPSCGLKAAMLDIWRKHFVLKESMLEMECTCLTPENVLKTSGHVDRFTDLMVKDLDTGECFRADKLLEEAIEKLLETELSDEDRMKHEKVSCQADAFSNIELDLKMKEYGLDNYSPSFPFNLMFQTNIGPEAKNVGYLRPETAQGLFVNFKRCLDLNAGKMPFASAQIGLGFRNEIAPRSGLLRVREFTMAEIEHFVNPNDKSHDKFNSVKLKQLSLLTSQNQLGSGLTVRTSVGNAVEKKLINNETLGYFMTRTQLYMEKIGLDPSKLRFRQHLSTEMAHYACDCWDLEILTSYGWIECVGHADRACYDLQVHSNATKIPMLATLKLETPKEVSIAKLKFNRKLLGQAFKKDQRIVSETLEKLALNWDEFYELVAQPLEVKGEFTIKEGFTVTKEMVSFQKVKKNVSEIKYAPSVIEPSFGIGRILYSLLEHVFYIREEDEQRCVMKFNPLVAPYKVAVLPISSNEECNAMVDEIANHLLEEEIRVRVDKSSAALGRRYARADELGVPFALTIDFQTLKDDTVTLRERDSMQQIRLTKKKLYPLLHDLLLMKLHWKTVVSEMYPIVSSNDTQSVQKNAVVLQDTGRGVFSRPAISPLLS